MTFLNSLQAFQPHFPDSVSLKQIQALISATHALSFYSLTLQHGVPFQPVSIRVHPDPLSLIEKALYQNRKSYTKLDDLLFIGRNLVLAGLPVYSSSLSSNGDSHHHHHHEHPPPPEEDNDAMITAERRIISLTVSSALSSDDFGTAYSYILTRLTPPSLLPSSSNHTTSSVKKTTYPGAPSTTQAAIVPHHQQQPIVPWNPKSPTSPNEWNSSPSL